MRCGVSDPTALNGFLSDTNQRLDSHARELEEIRRAMDDMRRLLAENTADVAEVFQRLRVKLLEKS